MKMSDSLLYLWLKEDVVFERNEKMVMLNPNKNVSQKPEWCTKLGGY